jgi:hypothetical protein
MFKGAAAEHIAAAYYMGKGLAVYWPAVPLENDLIVERKDGALHKVQVKFTSWTSYDRHYQQLHCRTYGWSGGRKKTAGPPKYDYLFVVAEDGRQWEIPADVLPENDVKLDVRGAKRPRKERTWDKYLVS